MPSGLRRRSATTRSRSPDLRRSLPRHQRRCGRSSTASRRSSGRGTTAGARRRPTWDGSAGSSPSTVAAIPRELGAADVTRFLSMLAVQGQVVRVDPEPGLQRAALPLPRRSRSASSPGLAKTDAREAAATDSPGPDAERSPGAPAASATASRSLMASLMYGAGLRLLECARLRVKDVDFDAWRDHSPRRKGPEGSRDRAPGAGGGRVARANRTGRAVHEADISRRRRVASRCRTRWPASTLSAAREWPWQWVFPAARASMSIRATASVDGITCTNP